MHIRKVEIGSYGCHVARVFDFGPGLTLATGPNGSGKSSIFDAMIWCIWGTRLRPFEPEGSDVLLTFSSGLPGAATALHRSVQGKTTETVEAAPWFQPTNKRRAEGLIESVFGEYDAWKRTLYMTGRSVSSFSGATPTEKYDYLARLTGAQEYDQAYNRCRGWTTEVDKLASDARRAAKTDSVDAGSLVRQVSIALQAIELDRTPSGGTRAQLEAGLAEWQQKLEGLSQEASKLADDLGEASRKLALLLEEESRAKNAYSRAPKVPCGECGTMLTPEAPGLLQALQEAASAVNGARTEYNALTAARNTLERKAVEARGEVGYFTMQLSDLDHANEILRSSEEDLLRHYKLLHGLEEKAEASSKAETKAEFDLQVHTRTLDVLKRARKRHLSTYLGRIESQANSNLDIIGAKPRITLDLTDGKLDVLATGTGAESYRCLSSGEQRRVDLCLLLAMSRVAADVGTVPTAAPMVIDEAFDTLDEAGVEALLFLACEEAKHRQVFLVSHIEPPIPAGMAGHLRL